MTPDPIQQNTGQTEVLSRIVTLTFGDFDVSVRLGPNDQLIEIVGVGIKKDFRTIEQILSRQKPIDVDDLYDVD